MNEAGIYRPTDLLRFPWETEKGEMMSQEEIEDMQAEMAAMNRMLSGEKNA
jgi:hypothetical protein